MRLLGVAILLLAVVGGAVLLRISKLTYEQKRQLNEKTPESGRAAP